MVKRPAQKRSNGPKVIDVGSSSEARKTISAAVWGQLAPLDEKARIKVEKWGDRLPKLVPPDLAGRFEAAYEALGEAVHANDVMATNKIAGQLMRAWDVLERAALDAGHAPLPPTAYAVRCGDAIVCFAMNGVAQVRRDNPTWIVYSFDDAARIVRSFAGDLYAKAVETFPQASVVSVTVDGETKSYDIDDEIPF